MFITAGDISRDGKMIILRTFDGKYNRSNIDNIVCIESVCLCVKYVYKLGQLQEQGYGTET